MGGRLLQLTASFDIHNSRIMQERMLSGKLSRVGLSLGLQKLGL